MLSNHDDRRFLRHCPMATPPKTSSLTTSTSVGSTTLDWLGFSFLAAASAAIALAARSSSGFHEYRSIFCFCIILVT